ncbi:MAG TPA: hypothetical protein VFV67_28580 [Actinophytocola sp.]|uniref:WXG100-like domain-containing protein n=1 Tax=Actinophytocola sp. TaxID=1872138 RepID=UPI002DBA4B3B|nr:hypothetical protein [Actinophytocola sp.]HEU5474622.1 hypothetical protein [Actinophytocola sp.]
MSREDEEFARETLALLNSIRTGTWLPPGLNAGGGLAALSADMRPIEALNAAGLGWLTPHVQPLQLVLDGLAGQATVIQQFADHWEKASAQVESIREQLAKRGIEETSDWTGPAGERYRGRALELVAALQATANVALATAAAAKQMGEAIADCRRRINELLTDLVQRLISYARQAIAVEGGVTPNVVAQCTAMIDTYRAPISAIEQRLIQAMDRLQRPDPLPAPAGPSVAEPILKALADVASSLLRGDVARGLGMAWRGVRSIFGRRGTRQHQREVDRAYRQRERERERQMNQDWRRHDRGTYRGSDYANGVRDTWGPPPNDGNTYVAHHNFPVNLGRRFERYGIDTSNPAWGSWAREADHARFSARFEQDWVRWLDQNPNATRAQVFDQARTLGRQYGYRVHF